jgi:hypothetical protein
MDEDDNTHTTNMATSFLQRIQQNNGTQQIVTTSRSLNVAKKKPSWDLERKSLSAKGCSLVVPYL